MIFYYSGTGNSAYVATAISQQIHETVPPQFIPHVKDLIPIPEAETIGFVFPIYSWGIPPIVTAFLEQLPKELLSDRYIWAVCTYGDEAGNAMKYFNKTLYKIIKREFDMCAGITMPNNYVLLPGFNVDVPSVIKKKIQAAPARIEEIAQYIINRKTDIMQVHTGSFPALRSMIFPLFKRRGINTKKWRVGELCISCGLCMRACPVNNISCDENGRPLWGNNCLSCCACFHTCPRRAIEYGNFTKNKGQYMFPGHT